MSKNPARSFVEFIRQQGVVGLATGFVLGASVQSLVRSFVDDIVNPLLGIIMKRADSLADAQFTVGESVIRYGNFLSLLLDFIIIAAVVFFIFKGLKLDKLDIKK